MRRWISRILLTLCGFIVVAIVAFQVILLTDFPQQLILDYINREFGLKVTARSLRMNMLGKTTLKDIALSLPDEKESLLVIPEMNISHTAPALIPFGGSFTLYEARIVNPTVNIKEVQNGRWNIKEFANHIQQINIDKKYRQKFSMPELNIIDGLLVITDFNGKTRKVDKILLHGEKQKQDIWNFEMNIASLLQATGEFSTETYDWNMSINAGGLKANKDQNSLFDLRLVAKGSTNNVMVSQLNIAYKNLQIEAAGDVALPSGQLNNAHADVVLLTNSPKADEKYLADVSGDIKCQTIITGTIMPVNLQLKSVLSGNDLSFKNKTVGAVRIPWQAEVDTKLLKYKTEQFQLFDGTWNLYGQYNLSKRSLESALHTNTVSLKSIIELLDIPLDCRGQLTANLEATVPVNNLNTTVISGNWDINDVKVPYFEADHASGLIDIQNGVVKFEQIHLNRNQGLISADASFRLAEPQNISIALESQKWPLYVPDYNMTLVANIKGRASVNVPNRTLKGTWQMSASAAVDDNNLAVASANVVIDGSTVDINNITITAFDGLANGKATISFANWANSKAYLQWRGIDISTLARSWPGNTEGITGKLLSDFTGKVSGSINVTQAQGKLPLEPVQIEVNGEISGGNWLNATISKYEISAYLGEKRLLIDKAELKAMDGTIKLAGSVTEHSGSFSTYINTDFSQLEMNQLVHLFMPKAKTVIGRLAGKGMLVILSDLHGMTGQVNITLSESDLAHTLIISTLYDAMNLRLGKNKPTGLGHIRLHFEGSSVEIPSFAYFNRGVDIRGGGTIDDITQGGKSAIRGYAAGSARPFKNISLPGIDDLDRLMTSLQNDVSSVQIRGTLAEPQVTVVPFKEISSSLRTLLWHQLLEPGKTNAN